jgi:lipoprotein NlpI
MHDGQTDADEFAANASQLDRGKWPGSVVALFLGLIAPDETLKAAESSATDSTRIQNTCEADFFVGMHWIAKSEPATARPLLQSAVDHCPHDSFPYPAAKFELSQLDSSH